MMDPEKSADRHPPAFSVVPSGFQARTVRHTFQTCQPRLLNPTLPDFSSVDQFPHFRLHVLRLHDRCSNEERFCPGIFQAQNVSWTFYAALVDHRTINMTMNRKDPCCRRQIQFERGKVSVVDSVQVWLMFGKLPKLLRTICF